MPRTATPLVLEIPDISKLSLATSAQIISLYYLFIPFTYLFPTTKVILFFFFAQNLKEERNIQFSSDIWEKKMGFYRLNEEIGVVSI